MRSEQTGMHAEGAGPHGGALCGGIAGADEFARSDHVQPFPLLDIATEPVLYMDRKERSVLKPQRNTWTNTMDN